MIMSMLYTLLIGMFYSNSICKLFMNYNRRNLDIFTIFTTYGLFGCSKTIYIGLILLVNNYHETIPSIIKTIIIKCRKNEQLNNIYVNIQNYATNIGLSEIVERFINFSDSLKDAMISILIYINNRIKQMYPSYKKTSEHIKSLKTFNKLTNVGKIDDFIENSDETRLQQLNSDLDSLLKLGSDIMTQTLSGNKNAQRHKVQKFMNDANKLFKKKSK